MTGDIAVVIGASGGVGGALVQVLRQDFRFDHVVAASRVRPTDWVDDARATWLAADILDETSLATASARIGALGAATLIIVATGMLHGTGVMPEKSLRALDAAAMTTLFQVNAIGPALVARHLLPLTPRDRVSVFAALSARVGSIEDNALGGWYSYRASKAALNMLVRTAALEHRRDHPLGICVAIHPGTVETPLSEPFLSSRGQRQVFTPALAAEHILKVLGDLAPDDNGRFYAWDGSKIPW